MNAARRKQLAEAVALIERAEDILREVSEAEQEAFDAMPESLQQGDRGERMQEVCNEADDLLGEFEDLAARVADLAG